MIEQICMYSIEEGDWLTVNNEVLYYSIHEDGSVIVEDIRGKIVKMFPKLRGNILEECLRKVIGEYIEENMSRLPWEMKIEKNKYRNINFREETYEGIHYQIKFSF
jgi:hypothetical protein